MKHNLRPCEARGIPGYFHKWCERSDILEPSLMKGGHSGGEIKYTLGIVEFEDGSICEFAPTVIKFTDRKD
jgi:hypothetical protein